MKSSLICTSLAAVGLLATPAFAGQWEGNPDLQNSILNKVDEPAYMGTGMSETRARFDFYGGFHSADIDKNGYVIGAAPPEKGAGDTYGGSYVLDVDR